MKLYILDSRGALNEYINEIETIFDEVDRRVSNLIDTKGIDVTVSENKRHTIPGRVLGGHTYGPYRIEISLDVSQEDFINKFTLQFPPDLAHELHHAARRKAIGYGRTLGEAIVTEGLAVHFAMEVYPGDPPPWATALDEKQYKRLLARARKEFSAVEYNHGAWFFGSNMMNIPHWTGYTIGYRLVGEYLKNKRVTASQCVGISAEQVLTV